MDIFRFLSPRLKRLFGIDLRSLALFRIGLAMLLLGDLIFRSFNLRAHYSDFGVLPRAALLEKFSELGHLSLHLINGTTPFQALLFILAAIFAVALLFGYRTRWATFFSWLLLISLHSRNGWVLQGGDVLLRVLLFWSLFLPLGACYSVDSALRTAPKKLPEKTLSAATVAILLQVCFVYWFTAALKTDARWWKEGSAVYYALNIDQMATSLGHYLLNFPKLLRLLTHATLAWEIVGPILVFTPFFIGPIRTAVVFFFIFFHFAMGASLELGPFPYICAVAWLVFLPTWFWEKIFSRLRSPERLGFKIYYDGDCGFCKKLVLLIRCFFLLPETPLLPAQEDPNIFDQMQAQNSWVLVNREGQSHFKFEAFTYLCQLSPLLWPFTPLLRWKPIRGLGDRLYQQVAGHRRASAQWLSWLKERPLSIDAPPWQDAVVVFFLAYIFLWNLRTLNFPKYSKIFPRELNFVGEIFRVDQMWSMFSPFPLIDDGWYVIPGKLKDGREVDLFQEGRPVSWEKPDDVAAMYKGERWRKYMMNLWDKDNAEHRLYYGRYLCRLWNSQHRGEEELQTFKIYFMREGTLPNYQKSKVEKVLLWDHQCFQRTDH
jgi:predicted DCC family thiol-disulfide oxidoreductase YuxK